MLTDRLRLLVKSFTSGYPHHQDFSKALDALEEDIKRLEGDRDAAWRVANAASDGHAAISAKLDALQRSYDEESTALNSLCSEFGASAGLDRVGWLREQLQRNQEMREALAIGARHRERLEAQISPPVTAEQVEIVDIGLGDNREGVKQGALVRVRRPSARWDEGVVWKLERRPDGSTSRLIPDDSGAAAAIVADVPGTYIVTGVRGLESVTTVFTVDVRLPDEAAPAVDERDEHRKTLVHLHEALSAADLMRKALLTAGCPPKGDPMVWASDVRNTVIGLKRDLHEAGQRFLAGESARRSELAEMAAACANLPFLIEPKDIRPISLLLALRDVAVRLVTSKPVGRVVVRFDRDESGAMLAKAWLADESGREATTLADLVVPPDEVAARHAAGTRGLLLEFPAAAVNPGSFAPVSGA